MTQIEFGVAQGHRRQVLSEQAVALLLAGVIVAAQASWLALLGYGTWRLLFC